MKIIPMNKDFILFRCLHNGPVNISDTESKSSDIEGLPLEQIDRNKRFLVRLVDAYGSCAMLGVEDNFVVAHARFYPQVIYERFPICCQDPGHAITTEIAEMELPPLVLQAERVLRITCFFVHKEYRGQGLCHDLIDAILKWAKNNNWSSIRCYAYLDNYWLSSEMCTPMLRTYSKHGFKKTGIVTIPEIKDYLQQIKDGKFGPEKKKEFEESSGGKDLSELVDLYEIERRL